jgi:hypothetical protein
MGIMRLKSNLSPQQHFIGLLLELVLFTTKGKRKKITYKITQLLQYGVYKAIMGSQLTSLRQIGTLDFSDLILTKSSSHCIPHGVPGED